MTELTDKQVTAYISNPAAIETHEIALEVMSCLDDEIASIQAQIDAVAIQVAVRPLSPDQESWLRRASHACAMRKRDHYKIMRRDKEIRGTKGPAMTPLTAERQAKRDVGIAKNQRLMAEAEARREKIKQTATLQHWFFQAAKQMLPAETFQQILQTAKTAGQIK